MATAVIMPKQGQSVETCIITKWFKKKGDSVTAGDILFSYETDKASFDLESQVDGILLDVFFDDGAEVPVLANVAAIGKAGETTDSLRPDNSVPGTASAVSPAGAEASETVVETPVRSFIATAADDKIRISPRARKLAEKRNINYTSLRGSGPNGRIIARDIENAGTSVTGKTLETGTEYTEQPLSNVRKLIAKAMHSSLQNSAQLTHHMSADVRLILNMRRSVKVKVSSDSSFPDITINDMICYCVIRALRKFPEANSHFLDEKIRTFKKVHLGLAVDTARGLMVPVVKNADEMDLPSLSKALKNAAEACRKGNIDPEAIKSTAASFTVSNLGNYGVEMFTPVVNLPQVAILGVCTIIHRPADIGNNIFGFIPYIGLSLTYDHRAIDGGPATLFLKEIKDQIEVFRY